MRIRMAGKEDFVEIHKLLAEIFPDAGARIGENDSFFVAEDNSLVGFVHFSEDERKIVVKGLGVAPGRRRGGVGGMLLDALLARAKAGRKSVFLKTRVDNPAAGLYASRGFFVKKTRGGTLLMVLRSPN